MEKIFTDGVLSYTYDAVTDRLTFIVTVDSQYDSIALEYATAAAAPANLFLDRNFNETTISYTIDHRDLEDTVPTDDIYFRVTGIKNDTYTELLGMYKVMPGFTGSYPVPKRYTILPSLTGSHEEVRQYTVNFMANSERIVIDEFNIFAIEVYNNDASHKIYFAPHELCSFTNALPIQRKAYYAKEISPDYAEVMDTVSFLGECGSGSDVRVIIHGSVK